MQKGIYRMILRGTLACVCLFNLVISAAVLAQHHDGRGGDPATRAGGKVTAVGSASITVQGRDDSATVINVTADTKYERNGQAATLADFKVGDFVSAHGARNSDGQFVADRVRGGDQPPGRGPGEGRLNGVFGELQAVDTAARTLTVKARDGSSQTIYTNTSTEFNRNRQAATLADFKAGDHVGANGSRNADGHFVADRVFGGDAPPRHGQQ
jgi:Cu/Ag efflux protein CusF